jgi:dTMP kinase
MFISFEGIDGCGKTTQLQLLNNYLIKLGHSVIAVREPGGPPLSEKIREILLDNKTNICKTAELLLFEAARAELTWTRIAPFLKDKEQWGDYKNFVLSDRFIDSTLAYQGYGRGLDIASIKTLNAIATNSIFPDITFYLQLPLAVAQQRSTNKNLDRIEQGGDNFLQKVIDGFDIIAAENPERIVIIDATQSVEKVFEDIINELKNKNII